MAVKFFQPSLHKEEAKQDLRGGMTPEECAVKFNISERTAYRYLKEIQEGPHQAKPGPTMYARRAPIKITMEMELKDALEFLEVIRKGLEHDK